MLMQYKSLLRHGLIIFLCGKLGKPIYTCVCGLPVRCNLKIQQTIMFEWRILYMECIHFDPQVQQTL